MRFLQYSFLARKKSSIHTLPDYSFTGVPGEQANDEILANDRVFGRLRMYIVDKITDRRSNHLHQGSATRNLGICSLRSTK